MHKELPTKFKHKNEVFKLWKYGQLTKAEQAWLG